MEFPDQELLTILKSYGELKQPVKLWRLFFNDPDLRHVENGICVVEFTKITRAIPKRIAVGSVEIGFKYTGQPATCYRCQSTEDMVKDCPKRRAGRFRGPTLFDKDENEIDSKPTATMTLFSPARAKAQSYAAALQRDHQDTSPELSLESTDVEPPDLHQTNLGFWQTQAPTSQGFRR